MSKKVLFLFFPIVLFFSCSKETISPEIFELTALQDAVVYEVNFKAYSPTRNLQAVIDRLDDLDSLEVNVIWLMPIYPEGQVNAVGSPYAVADYTEVNPDLGDLNKLTELVGAAHAHGMAVILDWVANHTAWDNPWITEHPDWYTQDGSGNIISPPGTGWNDVADLNYSNNNMRLAMIDAMWHWITETGIDGFRCDAADLVPFDFWQQANDSLRSRANKTLFMLAEGARPDHLTAGFDLNFGWSWYGDLKNVMNSNADVGSLPVASSTAPLHNRLVFTTNHDESAWDAAPPTLFGSQEAALTAFALTLTSGAGMPLIYGTQEVGRTGTVSFFNQSTTNWLSNPEILQAYQDLMRLYRIHPALRRGNREWFDTGYHMILFTRSWQNDQLLVMINPRDVEISTVCPETLRGVWVDLLTGDQLVLQDAFSAAPYSYRIMIRN